MTEREILTIRILKDYERRKFIGETFTSSDLIDLIPCSNGCIKRSLTGAEMMVAVREGALSIVGTKEIDLDIPIRKKYVLIMEIFLSKEPQKKQK